MKVLVTGGAGFIGRWVVKRFLDANAEVHVLDNLSNGSIKNIEEMIDNIDFTQGDVRDTELISSLFSEKFDICIHAAAQINVQRSIDNPSENFLVNVLGSENVLQHCHRTACKMVHMSSCMVYDLSGSKGINESHPLLPKSPYAASKLAADFAALGYYHAYGDNMTVLRPFNTYGPFQRTDTEGGVVPIFVKQALSGQPVTVFGTGRQTRDLLYVEDCADFVFRAATSAKTSGMVLNAGLDKDIKIIELAAMVAGDRKKVKFVKHPHPQSEIKKLLCDSSKARRLLGWRPKVGIAEGVEKLCDWMASRNSAADQ